LNEFKSAQAKKMGEVKMLNGFDTVKLLTSFQFALPSRYQAVTVLGLRYRFSFQGLNYRSFPLSKLVIFAILIGREIHSETKILSRKNKFTFLYFLLITRH
jgi:hypothetical protein